LDCVRYDKAGERILARSMEAAARALPDGQQIVIYKNNSDGKGNSYGCHENYLMDRSVPFGRIVQHVMPHFISRQLYTGAGKVGAAAVVLAMIEDAFFVDLDFPLAAPVQAMRRVSYDLELSRSLELADGRHMTALDIQWEYFELARKYAENRGLECVGDAVGA